MHRSSAVLKSHYRLIYNTETGHLCNYPSTILVAQRTTRKISGVGRICCEQGQSCKFVHGALTANFRAGCSSCSM